MHKKIYNFVKRIHVGKRVKVIVFLLVSTYAIICSFLLVKNSKKTVNIPTKTAVVENNQSNNEDIVSDFDKEIIYCYDLIKSKKTRVCKGSSAVWSEYNDDYMFKCVAQGLVHDYLQSSETYQDDRVYLFDKDYIEFPILTDTYITYKYEHLKNSDKTLFKVIMNFGKSVKSGERASYQIQLPEDIARNTIMAPWVLSPKQTFKFIGEAFSFQNDGIAVFSVSEFKQNAYYLSYMDFLQHAPENAKYLAVDINNPNREYISKFYVSVLKNGYSEDIGSVSVKSKNGYGQNELYIPICYEKNTSKLYFFKSNSFTNDDYYVADLTDKKENVSPVSSKLEYVTCLEKVLSLKELADKFPVAQQ